MPTAGSPAHKPAMPDPDLIIAPLAQADLPAAVRLQRDVYPAFLIEDEAAFQSRLELPDACCLAARLDGRLAGYLLAHGWAAEAPPPVGARLAPAGPAQVLFIHDLAVSPRARGRKVGEALIARALGRAAEAGLGRAELIAVEGAADYWRRLGFMETQTSPQLAAKVAAYGPRARWMTRQISG